jgi:hypothetical protein
MRAARLRSLDTTLTGFTNTTSSTARSFGRAPRRFRRRGRNHWPGTPANAAGVLTLYPDATQLLAGHLDAQIKALFAGAPADSAVTAYAEADGGNQQFTKIGISNARMMQVHARMHALFVGTPVKYGSVVCGEGAPSQSYIYPEGDFTGINLYDSGRDPMVEMDDFLKITRAATGKTNPTIMVAETNTNKPDHRSDWFMRMWVWCKN